MVQVQVCVSSGSNSCLLYPGIGHSFDLDMVISIKMNKKDITSK